MIGSHKIPDNSNIIFCTAGALHRVSSEIIVPPSVDSLVYDKFHHRQCADKDYLYPFFLARYANPRHARIGVSIINALTIMEDTDREADSSGLSG
jgi:hypothetical protein